MAGAAVQPLTIDISLSVLEDLGTNLYSSIPAVLSEAVANAWDADAHSVRVNIDAKNRTITVKDDGLGMSREAVQDRYLTVGYHRRENGAALTPGKRHAMGRKGIGKLSLFAIADAVEVVTRPTGGSATGFRLDAPKIRQRAKARQLYHPEEFPVSDPPKRGTVICLSKMRVEPSSLTTQALRKRLARRFGIIGSQFKFQIWVDDVEVTIDDRDDLPNLQYLWKIGTPIPDPTTAATHVDQTAKLPGNIKSPPKAAPKWEVKGWLGTFRDQHAVNVDEGDNQVAVLAWGKVIHEDLLANVKASGYFARYLIGRLEANFLDSDERPDIATSDRQAVKETDPRFAALRDWFQETIKRVAEDWNTWREGSSLQTAMEEFPAIKQWHAGLSPDAKKYAQQLFGKIGRLNKAEPAIKHELYRNAILAFERLRLREEMGRIDALSDAPDLTVLTSFFRGIDEIEEVEYHRIAEGRLSVVRKFQGLVADDAREKVLQTHLFDHLWLLDPSWERAAATEYMEKTVQAAFAKVTAKLSPAEKKGRIDIGYRTTAGKHVIVELKRASVRPSITELLGQLAKYRDALEKVLKTSADPDAGPPEIELVAVLGAEPAGPPTDRQAQRDLLDAIHARWITYSNLFENTAKAYQDYIDAHERASKLSELINSIGAADGD